MPRLPLRFPSYQLPPVSLSTSSSKLQGWENLNAAYAQNLFELEQANPYVRMIRTSTQSVANGSYVGVIWEAESTVFERQGMLPLSTGTSFIEIPFNGLWHLDAGVVWKDAGSTGKRNLLINKISGTGSTGSLNAMGMKLEDVAFQSISVTAPLFAGDRIVLTLFQNSGGSTGITVSNGLPFMSIAGVGVKA